MTPNDAQIDVLMRRYARHGESSAVSEHLDADELNAFAEGALPPAARSRYVSHLADCEDCRKLATHLAIAAGATTRTEAAEAAKTETISWWRKLGGLFSAPRLKYAAFAAVLVAAAGVTFIVLRERGSEISMVAQRSQPESEKEVSATTQPQESGSEAKQFDLKRAGTTPQPTTVPQATPGSVLRAEKEPSKSGETTISPPKPEGVPGKDLDAARKTDEAVMAKSGPPFSPPPPGEAGRAETKSREQQQNERANLASGPRKNEESSADKFKMADKSRPAEMQRDRRSEDDRNRAAASQPVHGPNRAQQQLRMEPSRPASQSANVQSAETAGRATGTAKPADAEATPETRSTGGRKFRRQGNTWIDTKFKSSMSVTNISRGSDEFRALDSRLRAIAEQLGGEIVVVWKGKAYRIR